MGVGSRLLAVVVLSLLASSGAAAERLGGVTAEAAAEPDPSPHATTPSELARVFPDHARALAEPGELVLLDDPMDHRRFTAFLAEQGARSVAYDGTLFRFAYSEVWVEYYPVPPVAASGVSLPAGPGLVAGVAALGLFGLAWVMWRRRKGT